MNRAQAQNIVRETFTDGFNKARFLNLARNLVHHLDESKAFVHNATYIKDAFRDHVARFERLGTYTTPEDEKIDVLIVHLTNASKLERARTAIRNFVADHLKERNDKDAALVAFVSPSENTWRFSLVKMEYTTVKKESGRVGVEARLTPARRFSYIVGEGESSHTAQTRFLDLLQETETDPTLADFEEAFSVEVVTKEFFTKYVELFEALYAALDKLVAKDKHLRDELTDKGVNTVDFAKKLLGQIVFLYFLQKKGWLGVAKGETWGSGPRNFLRGLANGEYGKYDNFFNDVLEPLFYEALATERDETGWYSRFKCRIPFLNGGLFEPLGDYDWRHTDILLPNKLFFNTEPVEYGIVGTGILDVFDRYNFTVNEAEPLEKDVAIDPEMLGKVFENLIEENRRKGLGAYYTPREIVHYMCQESLINYLDTAVNTRQESVIPEKPEQGKLFGTPDPHQPTLKLSAHHEVVSRADLETFVHLGEQISHYEAVPTEYRVKMPKSIEQNATKIDQVLADITVCDPAVGSGAYPVGMMTEIVRARSTLTPYFSDIRERTAYHFKRHAIQNCLYGVDIDAGAVEIAKLRLWLSLVVDEEDVKQIKPLPNLDYKIVAGNSLLGFPFKSQKLGKLEDLKQQFFDATDHDTKSALKLRLDELLGEVFAASKKSLGYTVDFDFEIFFSEVFQHNGGFDIVVANPPYIDSEGMTKDTPDLRKWVQSSYTMTKGNWDIYIAFYEKGFRLLNATGALSYITPDKWISKPFGDQLRLATTDKVFSILKAGRSVFESVKVDAIVTVFNQIPSPAIHIFDYLDREIRLKRVVPKSTLKPPYTYDWFFSDFVELLTKISATSGTLSQYGICENACATSDAYKLQPFIEEEPKNASTEKYLRMVNTGTIDKYLSKWGRREMVYLGKKYHCPVVNRTAFLKAFRNSYGKKAIRPKLILKGLNLLDACLDADGSVIPGKTTLIITSEKTEYLKIILSIVNSPLAFFYVKEKYPASSYNQGTTFTKEMLNELPIPQITPSDRVKLVTLVDQIINTKHANPESDVIAMQSKINQIIYTLYRLSSDEVALIENNG